MTIDLGIIRLDDEVVLRQLRQDLRDDWFPDPLGFDDVFRLRQIQSVVASNFAGNSGVYKPLQPQVLDVPKTNFTLRPSLETGLADRAIYQGLVGHLVPFYDGLLPWNVFSHRRNVSRGHKYIFRSGIESWKDFVGSVRTSIRSRPTLLSTDLANYYEGIDLSILQRTMFDLLPEIEATATEKGQLRVHLQHLFEYLRKWCYSPDRGLPQNRDASSFLGNMYLLMVDRFMIGRGYEYFRFMDDFKIACQDIFEARNALRELNLQLRKIGLAVNSGKTKFCEPGDIAALQGCLESPDPALRQIDAMWHTRSLKPISRSFVPLKDFTLRILREGGTDRRAFRFCINRLAALAHCPEFEVPSAYFADITPAIIDSLTRNPAATDQFVKYLVAVRVDGVQLDRISALLQDTRKSIYEWQNYWLWMLLIQKKYQSPGLMAHALNLVRIGADNADRSGAVLYAGSSGGDAERLVILEHFSRAQSYLGQRSSLIAIQEMPFKHVKQHVPGSLRADLKGIYRGFNRKGVYFEPPKAMPITRYIDQDRNYD